MRTHAPRREGFHNGHCGRLEQNPVFNAEIQFGSQLIDLDSARGLRLPQVSGMDGLAPCQTMLISTGDELLMWARWTPCDCGFRPCLMTTTATCQESESGRVPGCDHVLHIWETRILVCTKAIFRLICDERKKEPHQKFVS